MAMATDLGHTHPMGGVIMNSNDLPACDRMTLPVPDK